MKIGLFMMPSHPPERPIADAHEWDIRNIEHAEKVGFHEVWIGEHFTAPWEPVPAPDILLAQALQRTHTIKLAPGGHLLPYHHPAVLAHRIAYLDQISGGRMMFGVASGGVPTDWKLFDFVNMGDLNRDKTREAIEIILKLWNEDGPWEYHGKYWSVSKPAEMFGQLRYHMVPFQRPHPRLGIAGLSPNSETLLLAGEFGLMPMSIAFSTRHLHTHWDAVLRGAEKSGKTPSRATWRINTPAIVAETDDKALDLAVNGPTGRCFRDYLLPLWTAAGFIPAFKEDPDMADSDVTVEYMARKSWLVGSPETVREKIETLLERTGGFGCILATVFDHMGDEAPWFESLRLLAQEVLPHFADVCEDEPAIEPMVAE